MRTLIAIFAACLAAPAQSGRVTVAIDTSLGTIEAEIELDKAPVTGANFLRYVDAGRYENGIFHRTVKLDNQPDKRSRSK